MKIYIPESGAASGPDAVFMSECAKVDKNPPDTWQKYDRNTDAGAYNIMIMEINELKKAHDSGNIPELLENAYHVAAAALNLWRVHKHDK